MRDLRALFWLSLAAAALVAAHVALSTRRAASDGERASLAEGAETARMLVVRYAGKPTVTLTKTVSWNLVEPYAASVDARRVLRLLDALAYAPVLDALSDAELLRLGRVRDDFGLANPPVSVSVSGDAVSADVAFGNPTPDGRGVYASVSGSAVVYVVPSNVLAAAESSAEGFRRRTLFTVGPDAVSGFDIKTGATPRLKCVRSGDGWILPEQRDSVISTARVRRLLETVLSAEAVSFVWPVGAEGEPKDATAALLTGYGLDADAAVTVTFKCTDGVDRSMSLGKSAPDGNVYALGQRGGAVMTVLPALREALSAGPSALTDRRLFPLVAADVQTLSVRDGTTPCLLSRGTDGAWRMDAPVVANADSTAVGRLLARLLALTADDLAEKGLVVGLSTNAEPVTVRRSSVFARGLTPETLRSREIVRIAADDVRRISVLRPGSEKPVSVVRNENLRTWTVEASERGGTADGKMIAALLAAFDPLRAERIVKLKVEASDLAVYGLDAPALTVSVDRLQGEGVRRSLLIGKRTPDGRYATLGSSEAVFVLGEKTLRLLFAPIVTGPSHPLLP